MKTTLRILIERVVANLISGTLIYFIYQALK